MASYWTHLRVLPTSWCISSRFHLSPISNPIYHFLQIRSISTTQSLFLSKKLRKPNHSTLTKHLKPDGLTGPQRRAALLDKASRSKSKSEGSGGGGGGRGSGGGSGSRGGRKYVPIKQRLEPIKSDVRRPSLPRKSALRPFMSQESVSRPSLPRTPVSRPSLPRASASRPSLPQAPASRPSPSRILASRPSLPRMPVSRPSLPRAEASRSPLSQTPNPGRQIEPRTVISTESPLVESDQWGPQNVSKLAKRVSETRFETFGLLPEVLSALKTGVLASVPDPHPTEIQALAIPELMRLKKPHILCAAETGSGKTLAYLLPIIQHLKAQEALPQTDSRPLRRLDHPRAVILVPSRELISQVLSVCKSLSHIAKFRAVALTSHLKRHTLSSGPIDLLISTPTAFLTHIHNGVISLASTRHLVLDEADSLFDAGWGAECREIIETISKISADEPHQVVIVSATLPRSVNSVLDELLPGTQRITTPGMHRVLPNLRQSFVDLKRFNGNRQLALLEVLRRNTRDKKTMVFCNTRSSAEMLYIFLANKGVSALAMYQDAPGGREEAMRAFAAEDGEERSRLMVCTDVASRGVDTTWVDHVILGEGSHAGDEDTEGDKVGDSAKLMGGSMVFCAYSSKRLI
ncbi:P-loop containing nucleoside triphosphate hydrolase protein [Endogone sp. FLAS-F59071]|nr:P-loop containing nucleoside triphosphate hydrolase protein [Endogone sp. FLAS-F59071]|eukprot:RUS22078.1 P-loop containing nucleoside triphosphate hydrolase protein [Endogone sp. FLAS-F59071]